jgi:hypothetical protein
MGAWDETGSLTLGTAWKTVKAFLLESQYRYSPVSRMRRIRETGPPQTGPTSTPLVLLLSAKRQVIQATRAKKCVR